MIFVPLCSGSSGNCSYVEADGVRFLIDAGMSAKRITELLEDIDVPVESIRAILVTHEHSDHVSGVGVLAKKYGIPVFANTECFSAMPASLLEKIPASCIRIFDTDQDFFLSGVRIYPFHVPHDAANTVGYCIFAEGCKVTVITDVGRMDDRLISIAGESDLLLLEANHDVDMLLAGGYPYPLKQRILSPHGHLCNEDCGRALVKLHDRGVRNVVLAHLSRDNNTPELCRVTIESTLQAEGITDMRIAIAKRDGPTGIFRIS